jgi:C1A family cysteine protease
MIYQLLVLLAVVATASASLYTEDPSQQKQLWETFKLKFKKSYSTMDEETRRFGHFLENLKAADHRNELEKRRGGSAVHGTTQFSDLSQVEFETTYLTADVSQRSTDKTVAEFTRPVETTGLVDWSGKLTTPVKDQGYCGSCWAFSATEQIESDAIRTLGVTYLLSAEQITQCATAAYGCSGGWTEVAYNYVKKAGGMVTEANYPYTSYKGVTGTCKVDLSQAVIGVSSFYTLTSESAMASYVQSTGPLSVCVDANNWNSYTSGIMSVCGQSVDHCVQAVGVDVAGGYWKVRNSWNTNWGEAGYIRLAYGANTCAITNDPTYATVFKA